MRASRHPEPARRLQALDGLRGIAATAVVFFHLQGAFARAPQPWMPDWLARAFTAGHFGVNVFFALSGFVIAMSVQDAPLSWRFLGRFTLRRSVRLDPPMWTAIALELVLVAAGLRWFGDVVSSQMPTAAQVAANAVYLQEFLGYPHVSPVFWTLCYEIQFYVTFVGLLVLGATVGRRWSPRVERASLTTAFAGLFILSIAAHARWFEGYPRGLALDRWVEFFVGVLTYWTVSRRLPPWVLPMAVTAVLLSLPANARWPDLLVSTLTCAACAVSFAVPALDRRFAWRPLQWLGRLSYSTYLYHGSIGYRTVSLGQHLLGATLTAVTGPAVWLMALSAVFAASATIWYTVERPSLALARRIALTPQARAERIRAPRAG